MCSTRVYIMDSGAAGGLWHPPKWPPSRIFGKIRNYKKGGNWKKIDAGHVEYDRINHFADFC